MYLLCAYGLMGAGAVNVRHNISFVGEIEWYNNSAAFNGGKAGDINIYMYQACAKSMRACCI